MLRAVALVLMLVSGLSAATAGSDLQTPATMVLKAAAAPASPGLNGFNATTLFIARQAAEPACTRNDAGKPGDDPQPCAAPAAVPAPLQPHGASSLWLATVSSAPTGTAPAQHPRAPPTLLS